MENNSNLNEDNQNQQNQNQQNQNEEAQNQQNQMNWNPNQNNSWNASQNNNWNQNQFQNEGFDPNRNVQGTWNANGPFIPNQGQIKDVFAYLFLGCFVLNLIINIITNSLSGFLIANGSDYATAGYAGVTLISTIINLIVLLALIVFLVLDVFQISKAGYNIVGLILFGIFLRPAYILWRAYILKRNKTMPIIITVCTSVLTLVVIGFAVARVVTAMVQMSSMY